MLSRLRHRLSRTQKDRRLEPGLFEALDADALLAPHQRDINAIRRQVGVTPDHWKQCYEPVIRNYARFVQNLPASKADHHAAPGGLLAHGLEVARYTVELKQGVALPPGAAPEVQADMQDLWVYACFTAAFLSGLGKVVTDQRITLYNGDGTVQGVWMPISSPIPIGTRYRIVLIEQREYCEHQRISPLLAHHILPLEGQGWVGCNIEVLLAWLAAIQDNTSERGPVGEFIRQAERRSIERDLGSSSLGFDARHLLDSERRSDGVQFSLNPIKSNAGEEAGARDADTTVTTETETADGQPEGVGDSKKEAGNQFLTWLVRSIREESIDINTPEANIHVLPGGLALVPRIFRDFDSANGNSIQRRFLKLGIHRKTPKGKNVWSCQFNSKHSQRFSSVIFIPDAQSTLGVTLPGVNPAVALLSDQ